jgi:hypothetical protein
MRNYILPVLVLKLARRLFINDEIDEARGSASIGFAVMQSVKTISFRKVRMQHMGIECKSTR